MIGAVVGDYFGGSFDRARRADPAPTRRFRLRGGVGRRSSSRALLGIASTAPSRPPSGSSRWARQRQSTPSDERDRIADTHGSRRRGGRMSKTLGEVARACAGALRRGCARRRREHSAGASAARRLTRSRCSSSGCRRRSSPATTRRSSMGYYKKAGLDVTIKAGGPDIIPEQVVASGQAQFGVDWLPSLLAARDKGTDLVNIAQVFARSGHDASSRGRLRHQHDREDEGQEGRRLVGGNEFELFAALTRTASTRTTRATSRSSSSRST